MSYGTVLKTERGHDKSPHGKSFEGRKTAKYLSRKARRLKGKQVIQKELKELEIG